MPSVKESPSATYLLYRTTRPILPTVGAVRSALPAVPRSGIAQIGRQATKRPIIRHVGVPACERTPRIAKKGQVMTPIYRMARLARLIVAAIALMAGVALGSAAVAGGEPRECGIADEGIGRDECTAPAAGEPERAPATNTLQPSGDPFFPIVPFG